VATRLSPLGIRSVSIERPLNPPPQELEGEELGNHPILALTDLRIFELKNRTTA